MKPIILSVLLIVAACSGKNNTGDAVNAIEDLKAKPIQKEITAELITSLKDSELEQAIFDNLEWQLAGDSRDMAEKIKSMSKGQRAIYVTWITEAEVEESGLVGFYAHSGKILADFVVESFQTIGATDFAFLMEQADAIYRTQKEVSGKDPYESLENAFDDLYHEESLDKLKVEYIRKNAAEFVSH